MTKNINLNNVVTHRITDIFTFLNVEQVNVKSLMEKINVRVFALPMALFFTWLAFHYLTKGLFLSSYNLMYLMRQASIVGIATLGMVMIMVIGEIDLSVGSNVGLCATIAAILQVWYNWGTIPTLMVALVAGGLIGCWQGFWIAHMGLPSFIATLGGMLTFRGVQLFMTRGLSISPMSPQFEMIAQSFVPLNVSIILIATVFVFYLFITIKELSGKPQHGSQSFLLSRIKPLFALLGVALGLVYISTAMGLPMPVLILTVLSIIFFFITRKIRFGWHLYAIGSNREAARVVGIHVVRHIFFVFVIMGLLYAAAGSVLAARLSAASPNIGLFLELDVIAACVIGGTSLRGGRGTIPGALIGALLMASLTNGMCLLNLSTYLQYVAKGLILIFAVWFDISARKPKV